MFAQTCSPPPLHLIIGKDYCKLGDLPAAQRHLEQGQAAALALGDDGYSRMIQGGVDALATRLADG